MRILKNMQNAQKAPVAVPTEPNNDFRSYLRANKKTILITIGVSLPFFCILKYIYPYPDLFVDSNNYVDWAVRDLAVSYRPTGYTYLLKFLHGISDSAMFTIFVQYLFFLLSTLFCMLSADHLYGIPKKLMLPLLIAIVANPMLLLQVNMVSSDTIFSSLTVVWFTLCMWIAKRGNIPLILAQILLLYLCFEIRFMAMFYPVVAMVAIYFSTSKWTYKIAGMGLTIFVILLAVEREKDLVEKATGTRVFSGFSGWQIANNALYAYKYMDVDVTDMPSNEMKVLDGCVRFFIDSVNTVPGEVSSSYIWDRKSPLKQFVMANSVRSHIPYFPLWFSTSQLYNEYGWYLIKTFPKQYFQHFLLPNTRQYFYPDKEALWDYCDGRPQIPPATKQWFNFDTDVLSNRAPGLQKSIMPAFPALSMLLNAFNVLAIFYFLVRTFRVRKLVPSGMWKFFLTWSFFYLSFVGFTIFAASVNLRFMDPIFVLGFIAPFVLLRGANEYGKLKKESKTA